MLFGHVIQKRTRAGGGVGCTVPGVSLLAQLFSPQKPATCLSSSSAVFLPSGLSIVKEAVFPGLFSIL